MRDVEPDHRHRDPAAEHRARRLRVDERVELGGRRHVALGDRAAHPDDALEPRRARPGGARAGARRSSAAPSGRATTSRLDQLGEEVDGVHAERLRRRLGQRGPVEAALAVHVRGDAQRRARAAASAPAATGMSVRPASSSTLSALRVVFSSVWLPATVVTPRSSTSGEASASRIAIASSWPGSQSMRIGMLTASASTSSAVGSEDCAPEPRGGERAGDAGAAQRLVALAALEQRDDEARREGVAGGGAVDGARRRAARRARPPPRSRSSTAPSAPSVTAITPSRRCSASSS